MSWLEANWGAVSGWIAAAVGPTLVFLSTRRKTDVDESAMILGKWKELVDAHEAAIKRLTEEFDRERKRWTEDTVRLTHRIAELETEGRQKDIKIKGLEDEVSGLKRAIAQNSKSTAHFLGRDGRRNYSPEDDE
jgi:chromosome segregation ATPase